MIPPRDFPLALEFPDREPLWRALPIHPGDLLLRVRRRLWHRWLRTALYYAALLGVFGVSLGLLRLLGWALGAERGDSPGVGIALVGVPGTAVVWLLFQRIYALPRVAGGFLKRYEGKGMRHWLLTGAWQLLQILQVVGFCAGGVCILISSMITFATLKTQAAATAASTPRTPNEALAILSAASIIWLPCMMVAELARAGAWKILQSIVNRGRLELKRV